MNRQDRLIELCNKRKGWKVSDNGWCIQVKKGIEKFNVFDIPKYMLIDGYAIEIEHENYRDKPSRRKGSSKPTHTQRRVFYNVKDLVKYINDHDGKWERIIKKSQRR